MDLICPSPTAVPADEVEAMIVKKLKQCRVLFDFTKALSDVGQKDIKRDALLELVEYFATNRGFLTATIYKEIIEMVRSKFLLRASALLPPPFFSAFV